MRQRWSPDPKVIECLQREAKKDLTGRISVNNLVFTWEDILQQVRNGTEFGREYHRAFLESLPKLHERGF